MTATADRLWAGVERLIDGAALDGILAHKLGPLAARRRRSTGGPVARELAEEERAASFAMLSSAGLLRRIREVTDGPLVLLKGPELALRYPPGGRRFGDIDILVPNAEAVHQRLERSGFEQVPESGFQGDGAVHHHLVPLRWPVIPLLVEIHSSPNWPPGLAPPPPVEAIVEAAVPSATGIPGVRAPHLPHHALLLAAHAWRHEPLKTIRDVLDVAAMAAGENATEIEQTAREWRVARIWEATQRTADALFLEASPSVPLRLWARHLPAVRERTVFESHLQRVLSPFWGFPPGTATSEALAGLRAIASPAPNERWQPKLRRIPRAFRDARMPHSKRTSA